VQGLRQDIVQLKNELETIRTAATNACDKLCALIPTLPKNAQPPLRAVLLSMLLHIPDGPGLTHYMSMGELLTARSRMTDDFYALAKSHDSKCRDEGIRRIYAKMATSFIYAHSYPSPKDSRLS
jgi:hypothetical protein